MKKILLLFLSFPVIVTAQIIPIEIDSTNLKYMFIEGDSIPQLIVELQEALVLPKIKFQSKEAHIRYLILKRKTKKVYPYAKLAAERLVKLNKELAQIEKRRKKKKHAKKVQKYIEKEFSEELKKLTKTEGQILVKLIHRQTGETAFNLIKTLRNGWRAFWFQNTARLFKISLKKEFNPLQVEEDYLIEDILQRAFQNERLERQNAAFHIDYYACADKWK